MGFERIPPFLVRLEVCAMGIFERIVSREFIDKGWSGDKKYRAVCENGDVYLLRISPIEKLEMRKALWAVLQDVQKLDISMSRSLEMGECDEGVYMVQQWVDGVDAEEEVPKLARETQYELGYDAGETLKKLHSIPAPADQTPWDERFRKKALRKIEMYRNCPVKFDGGEAVVSYVENNLHLLTDRPHSRTHEWSARKGCALHSDARGAFLTRRRIYHAYSE